MLQNKIHVYIYILILITCVLMTACSSPHEIPENNEKTLVSSEDLEPETVWSLGTFPVSSPEAQGMDSSKLNEMFKKIQDYGYDIHHLLIIRNGYAVASCDFYPYTADNLHPLNSVTKSFTSFAIGKAVDEQLISSVDQPVLSFFKDRTIENPSDFKSQMTLEHLLTMTAGLDWSEDGNYGAPYDSYTLMARSENPMMYVLNQAVTTTPGEKYYYNTGLSYLLSGIITQVTKKSESDYVEEKLFTPLGIKDYFWWNDPQGITSGGSGLMLKAEDLAKFGYLYLNKGNWDGEQLISENWITASTTKKMDTPNGLAGRDGYGYQWWMNSFGGYSARGYRGQYLFTCPEENIVAVFYSGLSGSNYYVPEQLMKYFVLPSVQSPLAIDENTSSFAALQESIDRLEEKPAPTEHSAIPDTFKAIDAQTFETDEGYTISLDLTDVDAEIKLHWLANGDQYDVPVGLDGIYRVSTCPNFHMNGLDSPIGFRGSWSDDDTLLIEMRPLDNDSVYQLTLTYRNGNLTSKFSIN
ncbi:serine hydrolase domain-containing protein [Fusibacter ferrireducens]|uniref:Serine hydrolase n=1 Tax=Fusibacter ferrireducens TaxID=2785058 RepID=A0ABR9ZW34_9FIRM|nr:serine hydrolase [Fusibacter ferrireducens]MBF4694672.1 serine hydrolase [Fusibacter ferrireducens]